MLIIKFHYQLYNELYFQGLWLVIPSFVCIGIAQDLWMLYFGIFLFAVCTFQLFD